MPARRFPPPWTVEEQAACFVVVDHSGQKLAYIYFEEEPGRRSAAKLRTKDEARRIAVNMAKLRELLKHERASAARHPRVPTRTFNYHCTVVTSCRAADYGRAEVPVRV
jgi:hypothetical protein